MLLLPSLGIAKTHASCVVEGKEAVTYSCLPWTCRNKWVETSDPVSDFKIRVAVRFKPGSQYERSEIVLPLHQRLKMLKKGDGPHFCFSSLSAYAYLDTSVNQMTSRLMIFRDFLVAFDAPK